MRVLLSFFIFAFSLIKAKIPIEAKQKTHHILLTIVYGWSLKKYEELRTFIYKDIDNYGDNFILNYKANVKPSLDLLDEDDKVIYSVDLKNYTRKNLRDLVKDLGFTPIKELVPLDSESTENDMFTDEL